MRTHFIIAFIHKLIFLLVQDLDDPHFKKVHIQLDMHYIVYTTLVGVCRSSAGDEHLREYHEAMELESGLRCEQPSNFSIFLTCYLKGKYKRWSSIRPPCAKCSRDAPCLCTTCTNMQGDEALLLLKTRPATERVLVIHQNREVAKYAKEKQNREKITSERARIIQHFSP
jgi:hypothetical protein